MPATPARAAAFEILLRVDRDKSYATELLHSDKSARLSAADHGLTTELVMGTLRWRSLLDAELQHAATQRLARLDREVLIALRMGLYQLQFTRVPARAAIFESVELVKGARKRSAAAFVNAVLRKVAKGKLDDRLAAIEGSDAETLASSSAHPGWLVARWVENYGLERARAIAVHDQTVPATCLHVADDQVREELIKAGMKLSPGLLLSGAQRVVSGDVTKTRAYREGRIAIQDEGSQLVALLVGRGERILDCCAAPGGKTSLLAEHNANAQIVASDLHPHRARLLRELVRQPNVRVIAADARKLPIENRFDRVLADVPCSGTGTLARNPEIKWRLLPEDLRDLQARQIEILKSALARLAPGGRLVYSTCSLETEENEAVVEAVQRELAEFKIVESRVELEQLRRAGKLAWKDIDSLVRGAYLRTVPGVHPCDGFFAAIFQRESAG